MLGVLAREFRWQNNLAQPASFRNPVNTDVPIQCSQYCSHLSRITLPLMPNIFLINVGANSRHQKNAKSPLFADGTFVFVPHPIDADVGNWAFPTNAWPFTNGLGWHQTHYDPDWPNLTYGDYIFNPRAANLKAVEPQDILLFWALLWDNVGDNWFAFTDHQSWHLIGALRIEEILTAGQSAQDVKTANRLRASQNAHFWGENLDDGHMVFLGDTQHSALFQFAVPFVTQMSKSCLLYRAVRTAQGDYLPLSGGKWSSYIRSCRTICNLDDFDGRERAEILRDAIAEENDYDLLADL